MLGKTAGNLFWMSRYLERAENMARLLDVGFRITLTDSDVASSEWESVLRVSGGLTDYRSRYDTLETSNVINFLARATENPSSILACFKATRENGRLARTALTRDTWEALNSGWMRLSETLNTAIATQDIPDFLSLVRQECALVRGAIEGTQLRNDGYEFIRLGKHIERAHATSGLLNVKYYLLLPSADMVGSPIDQVQWDRILRCVSAERAFRGLYSGRPNSADIADFLILDRRMPRSLSFCTREITYAMDFLRGSYKISPPAYEQAYDLRALIENLNISQIFNIGLHEFVTNFIEKNANLASQIEEDYRFYK